LTLNLLIAGERGPIYKFAIISLIAYHIFMKKIPIRYLLLIAVVAIYLQGLLGGLKMAFITKEIGTSIDYTLNYETILINIFGSEIGTPSNNLAILIEHIPEHLPYLMGQSFLWDIQRAFVPGFIFSRDIFSATADWFTKTFFEEWWLKGGGVGFSIVGLGYVNFGVAGIVGLFAILGALLKKLYYMSAESIIPCLFYINFIPVFIYTIRSDLSVPISQGTKHILFPLVMIYVLGHVINQVFKSQNSEKQLV
jgi:oligosaccharide repeat unit polymerase